MVGAESAEESRVRDHAEPAFADKRGAEKRGWQRREEEEAVGDEVVVLQRGHQGLRFGRLAPVVVFDREPKSLRGKMVTVSEDHHLGFR